MRSCYLALCLLPLLVAAECPSQAVTYSYGFEGSFESWEADACDTMEYKNWSIELSQERAYAGAWSVEYYIENWNDATKVWIEKAFLVPPGRKYAVTLRWQLCSRDWGMANLFNVIASITNRNPETRDDFVSIGHTGTPGSGEWIWLPKSYSKTDIWPAQVSGLPGWGVIWAAPGIWGTWETPRTYYVDAVTVEIDSQPVTVSIPSAKGLPDDVYLRLENKVVTSGSSHLAQRIYVAEPDRTSGIGVQFSTASRQVQPGETISLSGVLATLSGERLIKNAAIE